MLPAILGRWLADPVCKVWYNPCVSIDQVEEAAGSEDKGDDLVLLEHNHEESSEGPFVAEWYLADRERFATTMRWVNEHCDKYGPREEGSFFSGYQEPDASLLDAASVTSGC